MRSCKCTGLLPLSYGPQKHMPVPSHQILFVCFHFVCRCSSVYLSCLRTHPVSMSKGSSSALRAKIRRGIRSGHPVWEHTASKHSERQSPLRGGHTTTGDQRHRASQQQSAKRWRPVDRGAPGREKARLCLATRPKNRAALRIGQRRQDRGALFPRS